LNYNLSDVCDDLRSKMSAAIVLVENRIFVHVQSSYSEIHESEGTRYLLLIDSAMFLP